MSQATKVVLGAVGVSLIVGEQQHADDERHPDRTEDDLRCLTHVRAFSG